MTDTLPADFMFQLTADQASALRSQAGASNTASVSTAGLLKSQIVTSNLSGRGGVRQLLNDPEPTPKPIGFRPDGAM